MDSIDRLLLRGEQAWEGGDYLTLNRCLQQLTSQVERLGLPLLNYGEPLLNWAVGLLEMGDFQQRWEMLKVFMRLEEIAIPRLLDVLANADDDDEELGWCVVRILGELKSPQAITPLVQIIQRNDDEDLRMMAATALGQIGQPALDAIATLLVCESTKLLAARCLSYIRHHSTIDLLLTVVNDQNDLVRLTAIEALSSFQDERVTDVLVQALSDRFDQVRKEALMGLGYRSQLSENLDLCQQIQTCLYDPNQEVACAAAIALGKVNSDIANQSLFQACQSSLISPQLQAEIILALSWSGQISGLEYLERILLDPNKSQYWLQIIVVLGRISQNFLKLKATNILINTLHSPHPAIHNPEIRSAIALSLGQLQQPPAIAPVTQLLEDQDTIVRYHAIAALKNLGCRGRAEE